MASGNSATTGDGREDNAGGFSQSTRGRTSKWYQFFELLEGTNRLKCKIENCTKTYQDGFPNNLSRHIQHSHPAVYDEMSKQKETTAQVEDKTNTLGPRANDLVKSLLFDVAVYRRPFSNYDENGIYEHLNDLLKSYKIKWRINGRNMRRLIIHSAKLLRMAMSEVIGDSLLHVMYDLASRKYRNFLGLNVSFFDKNDLLRIFSLGVIERHSSNSAVNIAEVVKQVKKFFICVTML